MNVIWIKRLGLGLIAAALLGGLYFMIRPLPVPVDIAPIARGEIETTLDEEGESRVMNVYQISAPIAGKLERLTVQAGDKVAKGERLAQLRPADPPIRDARTRRELAAATKAARAAIHLAQARLTKARSARVFSQNEMKRSKLLASTEAISIRALEQAELDLAVKNAQLAEAEASLELRRRELESAQARELLPTQLMQPVMPSQCCVPVVAPVSGTVLKLLTESEQVVGAGTPLVDIGNLSELEIVVDLLSMDAVGIAPGTLARIEDWGGDGALNARVRRKEPAGFTKISALGIEEQRVNVILDITDPPARWHKLGHSFQVTVRLITAFNDNALRVPLGALFRHGNQWAVYVEADGIARRTVITIGNLSRAFAEVTQGLDAGMRVILYPSDRVHNGSPVQLRSDAE